MQCPQCHQENPPQARFCLACGVRLTLACSACGTELPAGARFCLACGQPIPAPDTVQPRPTAPVAYTPKHLAEKILTARSALEGERKQVTVLFCDLAYLGEAYLMSGQIDKARDLVFQGLEITRDVKFQHGIGWAQRALGRIAQASDSLAEAESHLREALQTFVSTQARFEGGRTHLDLAALAHAVGDREATTTHLAEAHGLFTALQVPKYVVRAEQCAREFGVSLPKPLAF